MRYNHFTMLPERAFQKRPGGGMTLEGGGGGSPSHTTSTVTQSSIPDWLRPQTEALLGSATQEYFQTQRDPRTGQYNITGVRPYVPYSTDPRHYVAPFAPTQEAVFREAARMQTPAGFAGGTQLAALGARGGIESAEPAYAYGRQGQQSGLMGQQLGVTGGEFYGGMGAGYGAMGAGMAPEAQFYGRTGADIGLMGLRAERLGRDIGQEARGYARQAAGMGGLYEQMATDPRSVQAYMSPYQQNVTEIAKQQAIEDAKRTQLGANLGAVRQGTYGGARQTLAQTQREAALGKQLSDIQAQGLQRAFDQAQQAQQFGITTGLQGLQGAQAGLGTALQGGQLGLQGIGQAISGQQAGLQGLGQAGQLYGLGIQGAGMGLQGVGTQLQGTQQGMQGAQVGLQGVQGAQAGYGLGIQGGQVVANIAAQQQEAELNRMRFQAEQAAMQQAQEQRIIDQAVQNYAMAQESPYQRLAQYSGLLRGYATPTMTTESYRPSPSGLSQLAGLGTAIYGANMPGRKKGGVIEEGIDSLAIKKAKRKKVAA